jgi:iron complex outermembrane recepter protein
MKTSSQKPIDVILRWGVSISIWIGIVSGAGYCEPARAAAYASMPDDLTELSIEALMDIEITSLSKKSQKLADASAAVFVITQEDIRRSGALTIPEALRMVPGIQVARITASQWAITSRGFNGRFSNKLLVLIDGRSLYCPIFSGVFWEVQDTLLEDIERIEVIRGPGASLWGANAVNGVINIITKSAADTQGGLLTAGAGSEARGFGAMRYGGQAGEKLHYRLYGKYMDHDAAEFPGGATAEDDWDFLRGGFRADAAPDADDRFMFQGELYSGTTGDTSAIGTYVPPYAELLDYDGDFTGSHLLGRWEHDLGTDADLALQLYFDRAEWDSPVAGFRVDTYDADFQHRFQLGSRQEIIWGLGYRHIRDDLEGSQILILDPERDNQDLFSGFLQDEIELWEQTAFLTLGTKIEHNDFTGVEVQPNARLLVKVNDGNSVWLSAARAVRTPSRGETDSRARDLVIPPIPPSPLPVQPVVFGNDDFESEELWAYEAGYRTQPYDTFSVDMAIFYNDYDRLRTIELQAPQLELVPSPPHLIIPALLGNEMKGHTYGVEIAMDWQVSPRWRLQGAYSYLHANLELERLDVPQESLDEAEKSSPRHQASLRSSFNLPGNVELDLWGRYVDRLPAFDISSYVTLDARLAWEPVAGLELALVGQNLLDNRHLEFEPEFLGTQATEVERSVYVKLTWRF